MSGKTNMYEDYYLTDDSDFEDRVSEKNCECIPCDCDPIPMDKAPKHNMSLRTGNNSNKMPSQVRNIVNNAPFGMGKYFDKIENTGNIISNFYGKHAGHFHNVYQQTCRVSWYIFLCAATLILPAALKYKATHRV